MKPGAQKQMVLKKREKKRTNDNITGIPTVSIIDLVLSGGDSSKNKLKRDIFNEHFGKLQMNKKLNDINYQENK